jgi:hypothetical protein
VVDIRQLAQLGLPKGFFGLLPRRGIPLKKFPVLAAETMRERKFPTRLLF